MDHLYNSCSPAINTETYRYQNISTAIMHAKTLFIAFCVLFLSIEARIVAKRQVQELPGEILTTKPNKTEGYWTPERMLNSTPIEVNVDYDDFDNLNSTRFKRQSVWSADRMRSAGPIDHDISDSLRELGIEPPETLELTGLSEKYIADINEYPFYNYGKLFIKTAKGSGHCTAAFIRSNVLITAAHCVKNEHGWFDDFGFFQRFNGVDDSGRQIGVDKPFIFSTYIDDAGKKDFRWDFAFLTTTESADGTPLSAGFTGQPASDDLIYFAGYPADTEGGNKLIYSSGTRNSDINPLIHAPTNPLLGGSSGGAWITQDESGVYSVVGVASHGKPARGYSGAFSAVLNSEALELLTNAENEVSSGSGDVTMHIDDE